MNNCNYINKLYNVFILVFFLNKLYNVFRIFVYFFKGGRIMKRTSDSQKKAVQSYEENKDVIRSILPKGTKEKITSYGYTYNAFVNEAVAMMLKSLENSTETSEEQEIISAEQVPETNVKEEKMTIQQLQEILNEKSENNRIMKEETARKKKEKEEARKKAEEEECKKYVKNIKKKLYGEDVLIDEEKESLRRETIAKANFESEV